VTKEQEGVVFPSTAEFHRVLHGDEADFARLLEEQTGTDKKALKQHVQRTLEHTQSVMTKTVRRSILLLCSL